MLQKIILASLALIPFFCWHGWSDGIRTPKEVASILSLLAIVGVSLYGYSLKPFKNKWLLAFVGWCFFTTLISTNIPLYFDKIVLNMPCSILAFKHLFYIVLAVLSIVCVSSIHIDLNKVSKVINFSVILLCLYGLLQLFGCDEFFRVADPNTGWVGKSIWAGDWTQVGSFTHRIVATLGNPSIFGVFISICLPFSIYRIKQEGKFSLILGLILIAITRSTTAYMGVLVFSIFYLLFKNRKIAYSLILLVFIGTGIVCYKVPEVINDTGRINVIKESWTILYQKPITGMGLNSWEHLVGLNPDMVSKLKNQNWKEAHDEFWQIFFESGIIGLSLLLLTIWSTFSRFFRNINNETLILASSVLVILVVSLTHFPFRIGPLALYSVLIYGLFEQKIGEVT